MMVRTFVQKRKDVTEDELLEYNAFCQMLPGPSSTQTVMLIALKRGGVPLAILTLLLWVTPAALIMGLLSFVVRNFDTGVAMGNKFIPLNIFSYILPMSVGFVFFAAVRMMRTSVKYLATSAIMVGCMVIALLIQSPWVIPSLLIIAGTISNFSNNRIPTPLERPKRINWMHLWFFALIFILAGVLSELARNPAWEHGRIYHLFENFYRFGTIVFGGGAQLTSMVKYQYIPPPPHVQILTADQLLTGFGLVQAVPGPVFSVCTYIGGLVMGQYGTMWQIIGCITATVAVFLPSTLLLFFLFPIYENLKHHVIIFRALEGINAAVVGIIFASGMELFKTIAFDKSLSFEWSNLVVVIITFCMLTFTRIPAPLIVIGWLLLGWSLH